VVDHVIWKFWVHLGMVGLCQLTPWHQMHSMFHF
jgi:hypothetical protein